MYSEHYCGICLATTGLKFHKTLPDGEQCYICKDYKCCKARSKKLTGKALQANAEAL